MQQSTRGESADHLMAVVQRLAHVLGALIATALGLVLLFAVIGVLGPAVAIAALLIFCVASLAIFVWSNPGGASEDESLHRGGSHD
jgi:predicted membrane channel-forming protein YqfA (hemolysin III family)